MFFFGCFVYSSRRTQFRSVVRIRYRCTAHAYVMSRAFAQRIVEQPWRHIAYDDMLRSMTGDQAFAIYPSFAFQSGSSTDNSKLIKIDRVRRLIGGVRVLQRWNEFSGLKWAGIVVAHSIIILTLIAFVVFHQGGHWLPHWPALFHRN